MADLFSDTIDYQESGKRREWKKKRVERRREWKEEEERMREWNEKEEGMREVGRMRRKRS